MSTLVSMVVSKHMRWIRTKPSGQSELARATDQSMSEFVPLVVADNSVQPVA